MRDHLRRRWNGRKTSRPVGSCPGPCRPPRGEWFWRCAQPLRRGKDQAHGSGHDARVLMLKWLRASLHAHRKGGYFPSARWGGSQPALTGASRPPVRKGPVWFWCAGECSYLSELSTSNASILLTKPRNRGVFPILYRAAARFAARIRFRLYEL